MAVGDFSGVVSEIEPGKKFRSVVQSHVRDDDEFVVSVRLIVELGLRG
jgi:hypothetical protein